MAQWQRAPDHAVLQAAARQLAAYFAGDAAPFDLPLDLMALGDEKVGRRARPTVQIFVATAHCKVDIQRRGIERHCACCVSEIPHH